MRLLDTHTGHFVEEDPTRLRLLDTQAGYDFERIEYAILSHTWDQRKGEQTYKQLRKIQNRYEPQQDPSTIQHVPTSPSEATQSTIATHRSSTISSRSQSEAPRPIRDDPELSPKILEACAVARANAFRYIWIDSYCIDKPSSSELSEAVNSMYMWYAGATVCYAYLADVPAEEDPHAEGSWFRDSRWFTRGWTLQELIAPRDLVFLSQDWVAIGSKHILVPLVESVTGIDGRALLHLESLDIFSVSQRLSWASKRETTRVEDQAYSLLGLFDIHIPIVYGEGKRAFQHLQEQIMQRIPDQSLFAWGGIKFLPPSQNLEGPECRNIPMECAPISGRWLMSGADNSPSLFATDVSMFGTQNRSIQAVITNSAHKFRSTEPPHTASVPSFR